MIWDSYREQLVTIRERITSDLSIAGSAEDVRRMQETLASLDAAMAGIDAAQSALGSPSSVTTLAEPGGQGQLDASSETA